MPISIWWKPQNSLKIPSLDTDAVATHFLYKEKTFVFIDRDDDDT